MRSINSYRDELAQTESELRAITIKKSTKGVYDYDRGEVAVGNEEYNEYTDVEKAIKLRAKITELRDIINNYSVYAQAEQKGLETQKRLESEATEMYIKSTARDLYEKAQSEYHSKSLIGKVGALFSGKRPKKNLSDQQIQAIYGTEAKQQFVTGETEAKIAELEHEKAQQIEWTKNNLPPEKAQQRILYYEDYYDKQISELREGVSKGR